MFSKIATFWNVFINSIKQAYRVVKKIPTKAQKYEDISKPNFLAIFVNTLNNLVNTQATFDIDVENASAERLLPLCEDLEDKRYRITAPMLAHGDYYVFPYFNERGELRHSYLPQCMVQIMETDGDKITEAYAIIDWTINKDNKTFYLLRHHKLDNNNNLTIQYSVEDDNAKPASVAEWEYLKDSVIIYNNVDTIGFGRYKSPADSRGHSLVEGVPLNFGCEAIEKKIFNDLEQMRKEFKNGESVIFTDPRNLLKDPEKNQYRLAENIIPIRQRDGSAGANIDIYNPNLRFTEHYNKYVADLALYERQVGTSKGILTDNETSYTATATAVKRANADTIALIDKIRTAIDKGNLETLKADAVYLGIPDVWTYRSDWYDPFEDPTEQWQRLTEAKQEGAAETADLVQWIFPNLTPEQIAEKIERIKAENQGARDLALERILQ